MKRFVIPLLIALAGFVPAAAQTPPFDTAAVFTRGTEEVQVSGKGMYWLEFAQTGLYRFSTDKPAQVNLYVFDTSDGRPDGKTNPRLLRSAGGLYTPADLGPVLIPAGVRYLLAALPVRSATLTVGTEATLAAAGQLQEGDVLPAGNDWQKLIQFSDRLRLTLPATGDAPVKIEVIAEPRAEWSASVPQRRIVSGGVFPMVFAEDVELTLNADVPTGPEPLTLLRLTPVDGEYDEIEPNSGYENSNPQSYSIGGTFRGALLVDPDEDGLVFSLPEPQTIRFDITAEAEWLDYNVMLSARSGDEWVLLADRNAVRGVVGLPQTVLDAGEYRLSLRRNAANAPVPVDYTVTSEVVAPPGARREQEPNDTLDAARSLPDGGAVRGTLAEGNPDVFTFDIPEDGRLWRLIGVRGVERMILTDPKGRTMLDMRSDSGRLSADPLSLNFGRYAVELRGNGDYALKLMDLGPKPEGFEAEPDDTLETGVRMDFGTAYRGTFLRQNDYDYFLFRLDGKTPVEIGIQAPDDGGLRAELYQDGVGWGDQAELLAGRSYTYAANLPAGDYALLLRGTGEGARGVYTLGVERVARVDTGEPDELPENLRAVPMDGNIAGRVGMLDAVDLAHLALPGGAGQVLVGCQADVDPTWRILSYVDEKQLAYGRFAPEVIPYDSATGGAVRLRIEGSGREDADYTCQVRFAPQTAPEVTVVATETEAPLAVKPGTRVTGWLADKGDKDKIVLDYPDRALGAYVCRDAAGRLLSEAGRIESANSFAFSDAPFDNGVRPFRHDASRSGTLELSGYYAGNFPFAWTCDFYGADDMPTLADTGPLAPFTALEDRPEKDNAPSIALPPVLQPGRPDWIAATEARGDLPVSVSLRGLEMPLATYARAGQRVEVSVALENTGGTDISGRIEAVMLAEGWRVDGASQPVSVPEGAQQEIALTLYAPPMLSPTLAPALSVSVESGNGSAGEIFDIPLALDAPPRAPFAFWSAPPQMLGGVNVLNAAFGTKISRWNGQKTDDRKAEEYAYLHDGLAMHSGNRQIDGRELEFTLPETAPVTGAMIHLRSTEPRRYWASGYEIAVSENGTDWQVVAGGRLSASMRPQYIPFDGTVPARFMRLRTSGCQGDPECGRFSLPEVQLIASPDWKPATGIDIARLPLGGHVVYASDDFGGNWNVGLLTADQRAERFREKDERWPDEVAAVIGFEQNRAARIARIVWLADKPREDSFPAADVYASITGPGGPWRKIGTMAAPTGDFLQSEFRPEAPVWARYIRLSFPRDDEKPLFGPDGIAIYEDPAALSVTGLWEDDSPRGPYEFTQEIAPQSAPEPVGGASAEQAVPLPLDTPIASSVLIERNEDWWKLDVPEGLPRELVFDFGAGSRAEFVWELRDKNGEAVPFAPAGDGRDNTYGAIVEPGTYLLRIAEPPRSVVITWDTSGSVGAYIPKTLEAVRIWAKSLQPGRDVLQLLPFGEESVYLRDWAENPADVIPYLANLPESGSSAAEAALKIAAQALQAREGARGVVIITDAETGMDRELWPEVLAASPRVVSLSIDSSERENATIMQDWANINGGVFHRVVGVMGLADGLDMAASLFRAPKPYSLTASMEEVREPEGETTLTITALQPDPEKPVATGGIEVILDASGSMLKRMGNGERRIKVAHAALTALVQESLPNGTPFAFRAFGLEKDACRSELMLPLGPLDRAAAVRAINDVPAINLAKTAIGKSLLAAREDLADATEPRVVVLVTDGEETCDGDVEAAIATLRSGGFDVRVNIVGFAIDDAELAATFAVWAEQGGGAYFEAREAGALSEAITQAIQPRFTVTLEHYDGSEETVATVAAGETVTVPAGRLRIEPATAAIGDTLLVEARDGREIALQYDPAEGLGAPETP